MHSINKTLDLAHQAYSERLLLEHVPCETNKQNPKTQPCSIGNTLHIVSAALCSQNGSVKKNPKNYTVAVSTTMKSVPFQCCYLIGNYHPVKFSREIWLIKMS